jgi:ferritin-like metal-binding protein YciE
MKIETLDELLYEKLRELYDEEERLVDALPKMAKNSSSARLREAFEAHLEQTKEHVKRLESCFHDLTRDVESDTANAMKGLIKDGERAIGDIESSPLRDAALIGSAKCVEHYEMAAYEGAILFAKLLGREKVRNLLSQTLEDERQADAKLTEIAETAVNQEALQLGAHQRS